MDSSLPLPVAFRLAFGELALLLQTFDFADEELRDAGLYPSTLKLTQDVTSRLREMTGPKCREGECDRE